ncbi:MAG TPA: ABC transporter permease [Vicinamibacteria bacterium]|nr:ABC transporter permease [Vicinamibacteria bacterium]
MMAFVHTLRTFQKRPLFAAAVVAILGLGIGATTAVFSVVNGLLLSPLPYPEPDRLVRISKNDLQRGWSHYPVLYEELEAWREASESFDGMAALWYTGPSDKAITVDGAHRSVSVLPVTANYFDVLGVSALLGRTFVPADEDGADAPPVVLSYQTWQNLLASDPDIVDTILPIPGDAGYRVVGVLPPGVDYPSSAEAYVPLLALPAWRENRFFEADVVARLAPAVSIEEARAELLTIRARLTLEDPKEYAEMNLVVAPLLDTIVGDVRVALWLLFGAVGVVLLIAAANVASLLFVRGAERDRELAIRVAMGAGRARLTRQLFVETLVLAAVGGAAGLVLAYWGLSALLLLLPDTLPRAEGIALDGSVLAFAVIVTFLAAISSGLAPAWKASSQDALSTLRRGRGVFADWRTMSVLVVFELSLAFVLIVGAGLLGQAFLAQMRIERGFEPTNLTLAALQIPGNKYPMFGSFASRIELMDRLTERARAIPGVTDVTAVQHPPGSADAGVTGPLSVEGQTEEERERNPMVSIEWVPESYFETLGMTLLRGRPFQRSDRGNEPRVAVVTESFAAHHWPGEDPIGKRLGNGTTMAYTTVVGVAADVRYRELRKSWLDVYFPVGQTFNDGPQGGYYGGRALIVRSIYDAETLAPALRAAVQEVDPDIPVESIVPLDAILDREVARPRFQAVMLGLFAGTGLLLAAVGIYGVMATVTGARAPEIGIRLALGSTPREAVGAIWKRGAAISALGIGLGVIAAFATTRLLTSLLYGVSPLDPLSFAGATVFLSTTALVAAYLPARRAARVDPAITLRHE